MKATDIRTLKKVILGITPQTHVRSTKGDSILFRIPRYKLRPSGLARLKRLERYNEYKEEIYLEARQMSFILPTQGLSVHFFIPMPKTWRKWQKEMMHLKLHQNKPDVDNLLKALLDSLLKEDKSIGQFNELSKQWVDADKGWIEFVIGEKKYEESNFKIRSSGSEVQ